MLRLLLRIVRVGLVRSGEMHRHFIALKSYINAGMRSSIRKVAEVQLCIHRSTARLLLLERTSHANTKKPDNTCNPFRPLKRHVLNTRLQARRKPLRLFSEHHHPHQLPNHHVILARFHHCLSLRLVLHPNFPTLTLALKVHLLPILEFCQ